ncbi:hypothetical protein, partial [Thiomonas sp.]|uniref:hypothetical protein n=1 Tax=Thiomonas sp. TaxID=2047785 RepID=UPI00258800F3
MGEAACIQGRERCEKRVFRGQEVRSAAENQRTLPFAAFFTLRTHLGCRSDLLPVSRTTVKFVESITMENDGHEDESIQRRADHWVSPA